ncbi:hypothetical protein K488DRAFT_91713 [Vararia minispora EC-137]|uniref:Uncharacterized protein n=1 Tax=Vararia minispora EC-137 TaxID=1314806 RepID=A0ACB8Q557_9AGAM|nr:hypothetical protein K488DRAFT_91713 [Vararia minispora EC-137]
MSESLHLRSGAVRRAPSHIHLEVGCLNSLLDAAGVRAVLVGTGAGSETDPVQCRRRILETPPRRARTHAEPRVSRPRRLHLHCNLPRDPAAHASLSLPHLRSLRLSSFYFALAVLLSSLDVPPATRTDARVRSILRTGAGAVLATADPAALHIVHAQLTGGDAEASALAFVLLDPYPCTGVEGTADAAVTSATAHAHALCPPPSDLTSLFLALACMPCASLRTLVPATDVDVPDSRHLWETVGRSPALGVVTRLAVRSGAALALFDTLRTPGALPALCVLVFARKDLALRA